MLEKVLLVNFDFPPNDGIGGRRWAKLAKGLAESGVHVFVLKADPLPNHANSPWVDDVQHEKIKIESLQRFYPEVLQSQPRNWFEKLAYRFHLMRLRREVPGTIYDISLGWEKALIPAVETYCASRGIQTILATGAPWNMLYVLAQFVGSTSHVRLLVDFRDPWIGARNYGMLGLERRRLQYEEMKQRFVLENASWVVTPYPHLTKLLREFAPKSKAQFEVLPHFFDGSDFIQLVPLEPSPDIRLVYGGEMYVECEPQLQWLSQMLTQLKAKDIRLYERVVIDFYSPSNRSIFFLDHPQVRFHKPIGKAIVQKNQQSNALLLLLTQSKRDDLTTKFYEYLPLQKPMIGLGVEGGVTRFILDNKMGILWSEKLSFDQFYLDMLNLANGTTKCNSNFDVSQYELTAAVKQLRALIQ